MLDALPVAATAGRRNVVPIRVTTMSLFSRTKKTQVLASVGTGYSVLDAQLAMRGDIQTDGSLRVDGRLEGSILRADVVMIGVGATIVGNVHAKEVIVGGAVQGNVMATGRVELQKTATVTGDIESAAIHIQEGGAVHGRLMVRPTTDNRKRSAKDAAPRTQDGTAPAAPAAA